MPVTATDATISGVQARQSGGDVVVTWISTSPEGPDAWFHVYLDGRLAWSGRGTRAELPAPPTGRRIALDLLEVDPTDANRPRLDALTARADRVKLEWVASEGAVRYGVYSGSAPGDTTPDYAIELASVPADPLGMQGGGWGVGGFGEGGFGEGASTYQWISPPLASGSWTFGVRGFDGAGVAGPATLVTIAVTGAPQAPPPGTSGRRLDGLYNAGTRVLTLSWSASVA